jgi:hypothetical protein
MLLKDIRFDGPGRYLINVREEASTEIIEMFNVVKNKTEVAEDGSLRAQLIIDIKDQSELLSFLNILHDNHHTIMKVELILSSSGQKDLSNYLINH